MILMKDVPYFLYQEMYIHRFVYACGLTIEQFPVMQGNIQKTKQMDSGIKSVHLIGTLQTYIIFGYKIQKAIVDV